jgi:hypothetical protein
MRIVWSAFPPVQYNRNGEINSHNEGQIVCSIASFKIIAQKNSPVSEKFDIVTAVQNRPSGPPSCARPSRGGRAAAEKAPQGVSSEGA